MLEFLNNIIKPIEKYSSFNKYDSIFQNISDSYYHENYHSDILAYYLKNKFVKKQFINWINKVKVKCEADLIQYQDYESGPIYRESNRIDIVIFNNDESKAIIIENKSNNAVDQANQIFRYFQILKKRNVIVESIVYINKSANKWPILFDLTKDDKKEIEGLIIPIQLVGESSLCENVIDKVILNTNDIRLNGLSQEIKSLFYFITYGGTNMDSLEQFYNELKKDNNFEKMLTSIKAFNDIPIFLADRYKNYLITIFPKTTIWLYKPEILVIDFIINDIKYAMDVIFSRKEISIQFFNRSHNDKQLEDLKITMGNKFPFTEKLNTRYYINIDNILYDDYLKSKLVDIIQKFI